MLLTALWIVLVIATVDFIIANLDIAYRDKFYAMLSLCQVVYLFFWLHGFMFRIKDWYVSLSTIRVNNYTNLWLVFWLVTDRLLFILSLWFILGEMYPQCACSTANSVSWWWNVLWTNSVSKLTWMWWVSCIEVILLLHPAHCRQKICDLFPNNSF